MKQFAEPSQFILSEEKKQWFFSPSVPVLSAEFLIPQYKGKVPSPFLRRLNRYYRHCQHCFAAYCSLCLYPDAAAEFETAQRTGKPFSCPAALLKTTIAHNDSGIFSVFLDCTEWAGSDRALTLRRSDTWDLIHCQALTLRNFFPAGTDVRARCLAAGTAHSEEYGPEFPRRLKRFWNPRNFYLSPEGLSFFYQPCTLCSSPRICPTFILPFDTDVGPFWPIAKE